MRPGTALAPSFCGLTIALATPAAAEQVEQDASDIIVTAQRRAERLGDVPLSVSVLESSAIADLNARDTRDLSGIVPNLNMSSLNLGPGLAQISIRGVSSQDPEKSFDPAVGVFLDGVYLGTSAANLLDTFDLKRIEVLRGPQGTLFGRNTTGGAIVVERTQPTLAFGAAGRAIFGSANRRDLNAVLNLPLIAGSAGLKLTGARQRDSGVYDNDVPGGPTGARSFDAVSAALRVASGAEFDLTLTYDRNRDRSELPPYLPAYAANPVQARILPLPGQPDFRFEQPPDRLCVRFGRCFGRDFGRNARSNGPHRYRSSLDAVTLNATAAVEDLTLTLISGWRDAPEAVLVDFDALAETIFHVRRNQSYRQWSHEVRLASPADRRMSFVAGLYAFESRYTLDQFGTIDAATLPAVSLPLEQGPLAPLVRELGRSFVNGSGQSTRHRSRTLAAFFQGDLRFGAGERWKLTLGARVGHDRKAITQIIYGAAPNPPGSIFATQPLDLIGSATPPDGRPVTGNLSDAAGWTRIAPRAALAWSASPTLLVYGSIARGYNAGGYSGRAGTALDATTPFAPETVDAVEAGLKASWPAARVNLYAALFLNRYRNKQEEVSEPLDVSPFTSLTVRNAADAEIYGVETELSAELSSRFRLEASAGWLHARYTRFEAGVAPANVTPLLAPGPNGRPVVARADFSGLRLRRAPSLTASLRPVASFPLGSNMLRLNGTARYIGRMEAEFTNDPRGSIPPQLLVDAAARLEVSSVAGGRLIVGAFAKNLTNRRVQVGFARAGASRFGFAPEGQSWLAFAGVNEPRTFGVEIGLSY